MQNIWGARKNPFNRTPLKKDCIQYIRRMDTCQMLEGVFQNLFFLQSLHENWQLKPIDKYPKIGSRPLPYDDFAKNSCSFANGKKRKTVIGQKPWFSKEKRLFGWSLFCKNRQAYSGGWGFVVFESRYRSAVFSGIQKYNYRYIVANG
jgi:hypothetical protein